MKDDRHEHEQEVLYPEEEKENRRNRSIIQWVQHFKQTYGVPYMVLLSAVFFNIGFSVLSDLTIKDLFKHYLNLEPSEAQFFSSVIAFPWGFKVLFGFFIDNVKIFGSVRTIHLKISGIMMAVSLLLLRLPIFQHKYLTCALLFIFNIFGAITDVACSAIMVALSRRDPQNGPADLQTLHVIFVCIGGICGSLTASVANEILSPYDVLSLYCLIPLILSAVSFCVEDFPVNNSLKPLENFCASLKHMSNKIVFGTLVFMFLSRALVPSYGDIMYYFLINVLEFSKSVIALLSMIAFSTAIFGSFIYNLCLKNIDFRLMMLIAHIILGMAIMTTYLLVSRISKEVLGINDILFSFFTDMAVDVLYVAFVAMPILVVQTKIIPRNVEATIYSIFGSLRNLANDTVSPFVGGIIAKSCGVSRDNFTEISYIVIIQFLLNLVPICLIWMLPSSKTIEKYSLEIQRQNAAQERSEIESGSMIKKNEYTPFTDEESAVKNKQNADSPTSRPKKSMKINK
ncbi:unnamed protein product [Moneuplotes crassus]|uniref:Uncharacterized protein n=1 Tax=Euplotes crassus TaxID=5936 RepID=A0AAD1XAS9_EUPCR|nr:unnamed protein product [Moneuplotes crassus]